MDVIKSSAEITELFTQGKRYFNPYLTLLVLENRDLAHPGGRVAFIAGKKQGNAVWRNAAKRRMREICRQASGPWCGYDVAMMAKSGLTHASYADVLTALEGTLRKAGIEHEEGVEICR